MNRQDLHNMDISFISNKKIDIEYCKVMYGTGVLVSHNNFQFNVLAKPVRHRNRIVYKGRKLTCHLRKDGRYGISLYVLPGCNFTDTLKQVHNEMKTAFDAIKDDIKMKEADHAV